MLLPLPGAGIQNTMAPRVIRNFPDSKNSPIPAAVLMLLYPVNDKPFTLFIKRTEYPGVHSGQIGLPGGKVEPGDFDLTETALRETSEELGVLSNKIIIVGKLSPLFIRASGFDVQPFVGFMCDKPEFKPDLSEVSYLIEVSIDELVSPGVLKSELWQLHGTKVEIPFYHIQNEKIWGATAMIISEFIEIVKSSAKTRKSG